MRDALIILGSLSFLAFMEAAYFAVSWFGDRRTAELKRRLRAIGREGVLDSKLLRQGRLAATPGLAAALKIFPGATALERLVEQADAPITVAQLAGICAGGAGVAFGGALLLRLGGLAVLLLPILAGLAPVLFLMARRARRSSRLSEQLPEALDMMSRSLRAGHALPAAFQVVAGEMPEPIAIEFARAYEEQKLGRSLELAVQQIAARAPGNGDLQIFAVSTVIQRETGGNLAEILDNIARTVRDRYKFFGKLRALTGEGRASAVVLGLLPIIVAIVLSMMNPEYFARLFDNSRGRFIAGSGAAMWAFGLVWMHRMTKVDF